MPRQSHNTLDLVAEDLAQYIDDLSSQIAEAMSAGGTAPFAAQITEQEKLNYYTAALFSPDGTPNMQGRAREMQRLGPEGFASVYKAVIHAHPNLAIPAPPPGATIPPSEFPTIGPAGPHLPGLPSSLGIPRGAQQQLSDASNVGPSIGTGPLG
jgi:hypothetical protein